MSLEGAFPNEGYQFHRCLALRSVYSTRGKRATQTQTLAFPGSALPSSENREASRTRERERPQAHVASLESLKKAHGSLASEKQALEKPGSSEGLRLRPFFCEAQNLSWESVGDQDGMCLFHSMSKEKNSLISRSHAETRGVVEVAEWDLCVNHYWESCRVPG